MPQPHPWPKAQGRKRSRAVTRASDLEPLQNEGPKCDPSLHVQVHAIRNTRLLLGCGMQCCWRTACGAVRRAMAQSIAGVRHTVLYGVRHAVLSRGRHTALLGVPHSAIEPRHSVLFGCARGFHWWDHTILCSWVPRTVLLGGDARRWGMPHSSFVGIGDTAVSGCAFRSSWLDHAIRCCWSARHTVLMGGGGAHDAASHTWHNVSLKCTHTHKCFKRAQADTM